LVKIIMATESLVKLAAAEGVLALI